MSDRSHSPLPLNDKSGVFVDFAGGGVNNYGGEKLNREVPDQFKDFIKEAIKNGTGYKVTDIIYKQEPYKCCPRRPSLCQ